MKTDAHGGLVKWFPEKAKRTTCSSFNDSTQKRATVFRSTSLIFDDSGVEADEPIGAVVVFFELLLGYRLTRHHRPPETQTGINYR